MTQPEQDILYRVWHDKWNEYKEKMDAGGEPALIFDFLRELEQEGENRGWSEETIALLYCDFWHMAWVTQIRKEDCEWEKEQIVYFFELRRRHFYLTASYPSLTYCSFIDHYIESLTNMGEYLVSREIYREFIRDYSKFPLSLKDDEGCTVEQAINIVRSTWEECGVE